MSNFSYTYREPLMNGDAMFPPHLSRLVLSALLAAPAPAYAADMAHKPVAWTYDGQEDGQEMWGQLSKDFAQCEVGTLQSPIRIEYTTVKDLPKMRFDYKRSKGQVVFRDHSVQVDVDGENYLTDNKHTYRLKTIVFHSPSEHMILARYWLVEIQLMHEDDEGKKLNVAVMVSMSDSDNNAIKHLLGLAPNKEGYVMDVEFMPTALLPRKRTYYAYTGSMTTPPCTEGVEWRIMKHDTTMSKEQARKLSKIIGRNARVKQPVYLRTVLESKE